MGGLSSWLIPFGDFAADLAPDVGPVGGLLQAVAACSVVFIQVGGEVALSGGNYVERVLV
jgi:hypothetical protein